MFEENLSVLRHTPAYPGIVRVGWVPFAALGDCRVAVACGVPVALKVSPKWIASDSVPMVKVKADGENVSSELSFASRDSVPLSGVAWVYMTAKGRLMAVGIRPPHSGVMEVDDSSSSPGGDPESTSYVFKYPGAPYIVSM